MISIADMRSFLIEFNNSFPFDREYRKKYNIPFNSPAHRQICQVDVYMEHLEDELFTEHVNNYVENERKKELYNKGEWLSPSKVSEEDQSKLFDSIDLSNI